MKYNRVKIHIFLKIFSFFCGFTICTHNRVLCYITSSGVKYLHIDKNLLTVSFPFSLVIMCLYYWTVSSTLAQHKYIPQLNGFTGIFKKQNKTKKTHHTRFLVPLPLPYQCFASRHRICDCCNQWLAAAVTCPMLRDQKKEQWATSKGEY